MTAAVDPIFSGFLSHYLDYEASDPHAAIYCSNRTGPSCRLLNADYGSSILEKSGDLFSPYCRLMREDEFSVCCEELVTYTPKKCLVIGWAQCVSPDNAVSAFFAAQRDDEDLVLVHLDADKEGSQRMFEVLKGPLSSAVMIRPVIIISNHLEAEQIGDIA